ncbi:Uncharacterised protein [Pluralibacter gergoviae]|nr:Uncharacterised protein [Pluralibacter gergoviae]
MSHPATESISIVHRLPGRLRLRVPQLASCPDGAGWFRQQLLALPGVTGVRLRPAARSAVVEFDPRVSGAEALLAQIADIDWRQRSEGEYEPEYCMADNLVNAGGLALAQLLPKKWGGLSTLLLHRADPD